ncbi:DNA polymerase III subunit delta [Sporosarcina sp. NCCP-2222]|uniref:DNA polymerase III subunit delta n=1 Tax=Sporosarcina sp. NCCP-2222 TaxID=2935073 RepID=UPI00208A57DE|nr:DNA polymerase III subunit delta [Sporosarcina sp. NCCP-2222]GKV54352.1 DNA polymerase III subunit delta [Sporosarcina sp. NCCP-2222]
MANAQWKKIESGQLASVYLLTGVEQHIFDSTIKRIVKAMPDIEESSIIRYDLDETPVEIVLEEADTLPFLEDRKLIIANNASFLKASDKSKEKVVHNLEYLQSWLSNPSPTAIVVFVAPYEKLDGRLRVTKTILQKAEVIEAARLTGRDLTTWIQQEAGANGVQISAETSQLLVDWAGDDMLMLSNELLKIALFMGNQGEVTEDIIEKLVPRTPEMDVFRLTDAYLAGKVKEAISIYHDLLRNGEEPIMLTSLLAGQIRLMVHVSSLQRKGYHGQQIAKTLNVHPYRVKLMMENRQMPTMDRLLELLSKLAEIDYKLKSSSGKRERILELFFMEPVRL